MEDKIGARKHVKQHVVQTCSWEIVSERSDGMIVGHWTVFDLVEKSFS